METTSQVATPIAFPPPLGDWSSWLITSRRGAGKTHSAVDCVRRLVEMGAVKRVALMSATMEQAIEVFATGTTGFIVNSPGAIFTASRREIAWSNGARASLYSIDDLDRLRGPQHDIAIADDIGEWKGMAHALYALRITLRIGEAPRLIATRSEEWDAVSGPRARPC